MSWTVVSAGGKKEEFRFPQYRWRDIGRGECINYAGG
jgi:hypothetical protein